MPPCSEALPLAVVATEQYQLHTFGSLTRARVECLGPCKSEARFPHLRVTGMRQKMYYCLCMSKGLVSLDPHIRKFSACQVPAAGLKFKHHVYGMWPQEDRPC